MPNRKKINHPPLFTYSQSMAYNLRKCRKGVGLKQADVANALGVSISAVSSHENAKMEPSTLHLIAYSRLYDISVDELLKIHQFPINVGYSGHPYQLDPFSETPGIEEIINALVFERLLSPCPFSSSIHQISRVFFDPFEKLKNLRAPIDNKILHNNQVLTASSIRDVYNQFFDRYPHLSNHISSIDISDKEVIYNLNDPFFYWQLPFPFIVVEDNLRPIGTGFFKFKRFNQESIEVVLSEIESPREEYPDFEITFIHYKSESALKNALFKDRVDIAFGIDIDHEGYSTQKYLSRFGFYLMLDMDSTLCQMSDFQYSVSNAIATEEIASEMGINTMIPDRILQFYKLPGCDMTKKTLPDIQKDWWKNFSKSLKNPAIYVGTHKLIDPLHDNVIDIVISQLNDAGIDAKKATLRNKAMIYIDVLSPNSPYIGNISDSIFSYPHYIFLSPYLNIMSYKEKISLRNQNIISSPIHSLCQRKPFHDWILQMGTPIKIK